METLTTPRTIQALTASVLLALHLIPVYWLQVDAGRDYPEYPVLALMAAGLLAGMGFCVWAYRTLRRPTHTPTGNDPVNDAPRRGRLRAAGLALLTTLAAGAVLTVTVLGAAGSPLLGAAAWTIASLTALMLIARTPVVLAGAHTRQGAWLRWVGVATAGALAAASVPTATGLLDDRKAELSDEQYIASEVAAINSFIAQGGTIFAGDAPYGVLVSSEDDATTDPTKAAAVKASFGYVLTVTDGSRSCEKDARDEDRELAATLKQINGNTAPVAAHQALLGYPDGAVVTGTEITCRNLADDVVLKTQRILYYDRDGRVVPSPADDSLTARYLFMTQPGPYDAVVRLVEDGPVASWDNDARLRYYTDLINPLEVGDVDKYSYGF